MKPFPAKIQVILAWLVRVSVRLTVLSYAIVGFVRLLDCQWWPVIPLYSQILIGVAAVVTLVVLGFYVAEFCIRLVIFVLTMIGVYNIISFDADTTRHLIELEKQYWGK